MSASGDAPDPMEAYVAGMLKEVGEDPARDGLLKTPSRVSKAMRFFTQGYQQEPADILRERWWGCRRFRGPSRSSLAGFRSRNVSRWMLRKRSSRYSSPEESASWSRRSICA